MLFSRFYLGEFAMVNSWKDKRIGAMNRVIKRKGLSTLDYLDEYDSVCLSKCKNKTEYKLERKHEAKSNVINTRNMPE